MAKKGCGSKPRKGGRKTVPVRPHKRRPPRPRK